MSTIVQLARNYAMDSVFSDRCYDDDDWEAMLEQDFGDREKFDGFTPCEKYYGYSNDYVVAAVLSEYHAYIEFAQAVIKDFKQNNLHTEPFASLADEYLTQLENQS